MKFDVFIPISLKDRNKLKFLIPSIGKYIPNVNSIIVTSYAKDVEEIKEHLPVVSLYPITVISKESILPVDLSRINYRPEWIHQQYLKLFQNVTTTQYLTIDSDVIINKNLPMFEDGKPVCYIGQDQYNEPYFKFQKEILDLSRVYPHSFINDMNFFNRDIIKEMLQRSGYTVESFIEKSFDIITDDCFPGEPEIYGNYAQKYHPDKYVIRQAKTLQTARWAHNYDDIVWTDEEIIAEIEKMSLTDYDMATLHTWYLEKV